MKKLLRLALGLLAAVLILAVNYWLISPWFLGKGPANIGSIEVSYVSMGRFLRDNFPHLSYAPYWYFGFPFHLFYTPIFPVLETILNWLGGLPFWQTYRIISGAGYLLTPVALFFFTWFLTKKILPGVLAALGYSFLPSLFYYVLPTDEVAKDVINPNFLDPRRLVILQRWGEGPHILALVFLPLAGLFYLKALENRRLREVFLTAIFTGLTALTNAVGFYALVMLFLAIFFADSADKKKKTQPLVKTSLLTAGITYGLVAFWYNFSFIGTFFGEGGGVTKNYLALFPWGWVLLVVAISLLYYLFREVIKNKAIAITLVWFLILFVIVYSYYASAPPELSEARIEYAPQALRLMTEADMAFSVLLAVLVGSLVSFWEKKNKILGLAGNLGGILLVALLLNYGVKYFPYGRKAMAEEVDLDQTAEAEIANWLKGKVNILGGERVYVAGNYSFYLNYFTDVWQLRGGLYQARTHFWPEHIFYQLNHGQDREIALAWLKAANIKYLVVNLPDSREFYKEYRYPEKFLGLEEVYRENGDVIYQMPGVGSPAKVVDLAESKTLVAPKKADDEESLFTYAAWLEKGLPAAFRMVNNDFYQIEAKVGEGQGILVQMTYDQGFRARSNQGKVKIEKDPLGFMVLVPKEAGEYRIDLVHGSTWKLYLGYLITILTLISLLCLPLIRKKLPLVQ